MSDIVGEITNNSETKENVVKIKITSKNQSNNTNVIKCKHNQTVLGEKNEDGNKTAGNNLLNINEKH